MAADSQGTDSNGSRMTLKTPKIVRCGSRLFGYSSNMEPGQALLYHMPDDLDDTMPLDQWCAVKLVPWLREWFTVRGLTENRDGQTRLPMTLLVAQGGEFVVVECTGTVIRSASSFAAIGCGAPEARGCLFALRETFELERQKEPDAERAARTAVTAACCLDSGCGPPIVVEWTEAPEPVAEPALTYQTYTDGAASRT